MSRTSNHRTAIGNYHPLRSIQNNTTPSPQSDQNGSNQLPQQNKFLEQLKMEWQQNNLSTDAIERIKGFLNVLESEVGRARAKEMMSGIFNFIKKIPINEVVNAMSKEQNLGNLLKKLAESGNSSDILQKMMNNPEMKQTAMDMMQEMMSDEEKMAEMTEMMSKMLNPDNK